MGVVTFPRRHAGQRGPAAFVVGVPAISSTSTPLILSGVDAAAQAAILAEAARSAATVAELEASTERMVALLQPFVVDGSLGPAA